MFQKKKALKNNSYMWVCPDNRVVVCSINTDQTDGTFRTMNNESFKFSFNFSALFYFSPTDLDLDMLMLAGIIMFFLLTYN